MNATLAAELARRVRGDLRTDDTTRALFATDASNYRVPPLAVVSPRDAEDVVAAVTACRDLGLPVLARGAGTSLAGQACNAAVLLDFTRHLGRVLEVDPSTRLARVEPGCVLDVLQLAARPHGLRFGPDPSSHDRCTLGGMIANDACGARSLVHGRTSAHVAALDLVLQDGSRLRAGRALPIDHARLASDLAALSERCAPRVRERFPPLRRRVSGYALDALLPENGMDLARLSCGSEGTLAVTLEATVRLVEAPRHRVLLVLGFADIVEAADAVPELLARAGDDLHALEAVEASLLRGVRAKDREAFPVGGAWLFAELAGDEAAALQARADELSAALRRPALVTADPARMRLFWAVREAGVGATARLASGERTAPGWEDAAVPPSRLPSYLRGFRDLLARHGLRTALYGHFGEGCVHARIGFELGSAPGAARFRAFLDEAADLVVAHGGSLSGEHGDGIARGALLERMYGADIVGDFRALKRAWDPEGLLNPGRIVDAPAPDAHLRARALRPAEDDAVGARALDCVGVGACRRDDRGAMCPSFRATREEEHSPRGRAHLLAEFLAGGADVEGVRGDDVARALSLCVGCKACGSECPAGVDIPAMKAEFLARHHADAPRPPSHRLARVRRALELASRAPRLANVLSTLPPARALLERVAGLDADADADIVLPRLASSTFHERHGERARRTSLKRVTLFIDTFTNFLEPGVGEAAVDVIERAGVGVDAPPLPCCGRPLFDLGFLDEARASLNALVAALPRDGSEIVGLEPACVSMLRDEAPRLLGRGVPRVAFFGEWAAENAAKLPATAARILVQPHCHERALGSPDGLSRLGDRVRVLDAGCCGMAGAFGLAADTRAVSRAIGEHAVLPALREAPRDAVIVSDGFSCRRRSLEGAGRQALHLAEALRRESG